MMSIEALFAGIVFWVSFAFSPGPFWVAWMHLHAQSELWPPYKDYLPYLLLVFSSHTFILAIAVQWFGHLHPIGVLALYFIGGGYIFYLAIQAVQAQWKKRTVIFGFKQMVLLSLTNPKVYLTIPAGALTAEFYEGRYVLNALIFSFVLLIPINLSGSFLFAYWGRVSNRLAVNRVGYIAAFLLAVYGLYLCIEGLLLVPEIF